MGGSGIGRNGKPELAIIEEIQTNMGTGKEGKERGKEGARMAFHSILGLCISGNGREHQLIQLDYFLQRGSTIKKGVVVQGV